MLSDDNYQSLLLFRDAVSTWIPRPSSLSWNRVQWLIRNGFLLGKPLRGALNPGEGTTHIFQITVDGLDALKRFEQMSEDIARNRAKEKEEKRVSARERRLDRQFHALFFFLGLILGWLLSNITPQQVLSAIRKWFP